MLTGPPESAGITTAVLGISCTGGPVISIEQYAGEGFGEGAVNVIDAGPDTDGGPFVPMEVVPARSAAK